MRNERKRRKDKSGTFEREYLPGGTLIDVAVEYTFFFLAAHL